MFQLSKDCALTQTHKRPPSRLNDQLQGFNDEATQILLLISENLQSIASLVETICSSLAENSHIGQFRDISSRIYERFSGCTNSNELRQCSEDLFQLFEDLLKHCQNREIECALLQRNIGILGSLMNQRHGSSMVVDVGSLIKDNLAEILSLKLEN